MFFASVRTLAGRIPSLAWGLFCLILLVAPATNAQIAGIEPRPDQSLTLVEAIQKAIAASPKLQAAEFGIAAASGTQQQAELYPNPEASFGIENIGSTGNLNGNDVIQTTVGVSQLIEMGGKRSARRAVASAGRLTAETDVQVARLDLIRDVTIAYANALAAQQSLEIAQELETAAREVLADVTRRVNAARDPLFQKSKAEVAYAASTVTRQSAETALTAAQQRLARYWGALGISGTLSENGYRPIAAPLPLLDYELLLRSAPDLEKFRKAVATREAELHLAEANAVPDLTASAGVRHFGGTSGATFVAGLSIPIPILNQNQGEIARSGAEVRRAAQELRQAELERGQELVSAWSLWRSAWVEANAIRDRSLPEADRAYALALDGYHRGAFAYLEVLDAQRTRFEQRTKYAEALARLRTARAETERLAPAASTTGGLQ